MPKAALKSFVRQAQLERKVARQKDEGVKMWWNVARDGQRMEVVATNEMDAKLTAAKEWGIVASDANLSSMTVKPLRPYDDTAGGSQVVAQQPTTPQWGIWDIQQDGFVNSRGGIGPGQGRLIGGDTYDAARNSARNNGLLDRLEGGEFEIRQIPQQAAEQGGGLYKIFDTNGRLIAGDEYGSDRAALARAGVWAMQRGVDVVVKNAQGEEVGRVSSSGEITPTAQTNQGNWGIWIDANNRFANQPGEYARGAEVPLYRFPSREAAEQWIEQQRAERPNMRSDIEVREIEPAEPIPGSTLDLQRQRAAQQPESEPPRYEMYRISDGRTVEANGMPIQFVALNPEDAERKLRIYAASHNLGAPELFAVRSVLQLPAQQTDVNPLRPTGPGPWEVASRANNQVYYNTGHTQRAAAETEARTWLTQNGHNPAEFEVRTREGVRNTDAEQGGLIDVAGEQPATAPQTLTRPGQGQQVFTGDWRVLINGEQVYQFGGVGNSQSDANRVGRDWVLQQIRQGTLNPANGADIEVLPVMGAA